LTPASIFYVLLVYSGALLSVHNIIFVPSYWNCVSYKIAAV